jgi:hypothetical protein
LKSSLQVTANIETKDDGLLREKYRRNMVLCKVAAACRNLRDAFSLGWDVRFCSRFHSFNVASCQSNLLGGEVYSILDVSL